VKEMLRDRANFVLLILPFRRGLKEPDIDNRSCKICMRD